MKMILCTIFLSFFLSSFAWPQEEEQIFKEWEKLEKEKELLLANSDKLEKEKNLLSAKLETIEKEKNLLSAKLETIEKEKNLLLTKLAKMLKEQQCHIDWLVKWSVNGAIATASPAVFHNRIMLRWKPYKSPEFDQCCFHKVATPVEEYGIRRLKPNSKEEDKWFSVGKVLFFDDTDESLQPGVTYYYEIFAFRTCHCDEERKLYGDIKINQYITPNGTPVAGSKAP